jgi:hypothetical protein
MHVTYGFSKISLHISKTLYGSTYAMDDGTDDFARAVGYTQKMFKKLTTGVNLINILCECKLWL